MVPIGMGAVDIKHHKGGGGGGGGGIYRFRVLGYKLFKDHLLL